MANPFSIEISKHILDPVKGSWIEFLVIRGEVRHARFFALEDVNTSPIELRRWLGRSGVAVDKAVLTAIWSGLSDLPTPVEGCVAEVPGWHGTNFVLPSGVIGIGAANIVNETAIAGDGKWRGSGTLEQWQENVAQKLKSSPVAIFGVLLALAGPLLRFTNETSVISMLSGKASLGKTTLAAIGGGVWGGAGNLPFIETFAKTPEAFEAAMTRHHDTFLALDETGLLDANPRKAGQNFHEILMRLSSETTKEKYRQTSASATIRGTCLMTSNFTAKELLHRAKLSYESHHAVRLLEIPVHSKSLPIFGFGTVTAEKMAKKVRRLRKLARRYAGVAGPAFVARIVADLVESEPKLQARIREYRDEGLVALKLATSATRDERRLAEKVVVIYAAGRLAIHYKILLYSVEELSAAVQTVWIGIRKNALASVVHDPLQVFLRKLIKAKKTLTDITAARPSMTKAEAKTATGFIKYIGANVEICLPKVSFDQLTPNGKAVLNSLEARGLLQREGSESKQPKAGKRQAYPVVAHDKKKSPIRIRAYKIVAQLDVLERLARPHKKGSSSMAGA